MPQPAVLARIALPAPGGTVPALMARPAAGPACGGIVVAQHIGGLSPTMEGEALRAAELGFVCVIPGLYHRLGEIVIDPVSDHPDIAEIRRICLASLTPEGVAADLGAALDWLDRAAGLAPAPRVLLGYGGGAAQALQTALAMPGRVAGVASILGAGFLDPATLVPRLPLQAATMPLYFGFAGADRIIPAAQVAALGRHLAAAGCRHRLTEHPGARHGYAFRARAEYDAAASAADWAAIAAMAEGEVANEQQAEERRGRTA